MARLMLMLSAPLLIPLSRQMGIAAESRGFINRCLRELERFSRCQLLRIFFACPMCCGLSTKIEEGSLVGIGNVRCLEMSIHEREQ